MTKVEELAAKVLAMTPQNRLRLAAELIDRGDTESVSTIITDELMLAKLMRAR